MQTSRKTLATHDWMLARNELQDVKTIQKIESLKKKNLWSLRQLKQHKSAPRAKTHWDSMLDEMKWMRTDFKQERRWKIAMAHMVAMAVMEWHNAEDKSTVCVETRIPEPIGIPSTPMVIDEEELPSTTIPDAAPSLQETDSNIPAEPMDVEESLPKPELTIDTTMPESSSEDPIKTDAMMGADTVDSVMKSERDILNNIDTGNTPTAMDTADESSMPTTPNINAPPSLSADIIQEYRSIVKEFDPNMPILTLTIEDFGEFDASALFPDMLTYEPPNPNYNDMYFNELEYGRVAPITKLISQQLTLKAPQRYSRKRDIDGNPIIYQDEANKLDIKLLPRHERYDNTPLISRKSIL